MEPGAHKHPKDPTVLPLSTASCPAPVPGIAEEEAGTASLLPYHIHGPFQHPPWLGTAGRRHQRAKSQDSPASVCLLPTPHHIYFPCHINITDTPSRYPQQ